MSTGCWLFCVPTLVYAVPPQTGGQYWKVGGTVKKFPALRAGLLVPLHFQIASGASGHEDSPFAGGQHLLARMWTASTISTAAWKHAYITITILLQNGSAIFAMYSPRNIVTTRRMHKTHRTIVVIQRQLAFLVKPLKAEKLWYIWRKKEN